MTSTLKKLDRVMINEKFIATYPDAFAKFHPYLVSDHSPAVLTIPDVLKKKRKSFRFANYIADKKEFLHLVQQFWSADVEGFQMYKVVKLKSLKRPLNELKWKNGNLFKRVVDLKAELKDA
jgi:hypothetical protein